MVENSIKPVSASRTDGLIRVAAVAAVAVLYFFAARLGLSLAFVHTNVSAVWPPTGIAIAAVLLLGYRVWPGVLIGAFLANALTPVPIATAGVIAIGNTLEAVSAAYLLRSVNFHNSLDRARDVFKFVVAASLCTMISATIGDLSLCVSHAARWSDFASLWMTWWLGDLTGAVTVAPLILTWGGAKDLWLPKRRYLEGALLLVLLSLSAIVTFGKSSPAPIHYFALTRLIVPFLLWAAFRLGRRGVTAAIIVTSAFAVWGTVHGAGPFIGATPNESLLMLQLFLGSNAVTFLFLGAVVTERRRSEERRRANERRLAANVAITRILAESPTLNQAMPRILQTVGHSLGWELGVIWTLDDAANVLRSVDVWRSSAVRGAEFEAVCRQRTFEKGVGLPGRVWANRLPAWISDVTRDDNFPRGPIAMAEGLHGACAFPVLFDRKFMGVMEFFSRQTREPDQALLDMFEGIGNQIGQFVERKRAEEALEPASRLPAENPAPVMRLDGGRIVGYANPAAEQILVSWNIKIGNEVPPDIAEIAKATLATGTKRELELPFGKHTYFVSFAPVVHSAYVNLYFTDITNLKQTRQALLQNQQWLNLTMEGGRMGTWTHDLDGTNRVIWSPELERIFGLEPGQFPQTEQAFFEFVHPDDRERVAKAVRNAIEHRMAYDVEFRYTPRNGSERWMLGRGRGFYDDKGKPYRLAGLGWDITERKRLEESLADAARQKQAQYVLADRLHRAASLSEVYEAALDAIMLGAKCDRASILLNDHSRVMRFVGWRGLSDDYRAAVEGYSPWKPDDPNPQFVSIPDVDTADLDHELKAVIASEGIRAAAFIPLVSNGKLIGKLMTYYNSLHHFTNDEIDLSLTLARQLATGIERKRSEAALRESEKRYRSVIEALPAAVYMTDAAGRITMFNQAAVDFSGRVPEIGSDSWCVTWKLYWPDGTPMPHEECPMAMTLKQGKPIVGCEAIAERPDGTRRNFMPYPTPIHDSAGRLIGAINMLVDITDRKQAEEVIRRSEKELTEFFENASEAINWIGPDGTILRANQAELRMLGYGAEEYIGKDIKDFHVDKHAISDILARVRQGESLRSYAAQMRAQDGSIRDILINCSGYFENGEFLHTRCFTRDVTEQLRIEKTLRHFAAIVESTDDVVISKDLNGIIMSWNPAAERLYGYKFEEIVGRPVSILIPPERPDEEPAILERLRRGERIDHYETVRMARDGRRMNVSLTVSPIKDASGKVIGASKIARDITEQRRVQQEIARLLAGERAARQDAEIANKTKDEFLAVLSHELRTPLTAMLGWLSILRGHKLDKQTTEHAIETIERNAKAQAQLIEDLVDISRIVGGKLNLELRPLDLHPVINAAIEVIRPAAEAKDIKLEMNFDPSVGVVSGDPVRLQQVIWNLLSNAVKFTPKGGTIYIDFRRAGSSAEVVVRDTGVGVSADFLPFVFERFRQAESPVTRSHRGMGLGLAIVRHLVELHGGTVSAQSEGENKGSTFWIRLPFVEANPPIVVETLEQAIDAGMLKGVKVLLVEDEPDARELIALALRQSGAAVEAVDSAGNALDRMKFFNPDVLLSDIGLPVQSGYDLIRHIRAMSTTLNKVPAIALTAFATENDRQMSLAAGFHAHLAKPVDPQHLVEVIRSLLPNGEQPGIGRS
jgi:PAS domain S-box-containing protein